MISFYQSYQSGIETTERVKNRNGRFTTNRTNLELKLLYSSYPRPCLDPTNRTNLELKLKERWEILEEMITTNRTNLELKLPRE